MHSEPASDHQLGEYRQTRYRRGAASAVSSFRINNLGRSTVSKNKRSPAVFAKKSSIVATEIALALLAAQFAYAQQAPERVERVEITGSRLPQLEVEEIGRASCREREEREVGGGSVEKRNNKKEERGDRRI